MFGTLSLDREVNIPASKAWELYGTLKLNDVLEEQLSYKIEVLEGDGGVGTVLSVTFPPGTSPFTVYKEKFTKIDEEQRLIDVELIEGGYLDVGFTFYNVRFQVIEKSEDWCITKTIIEYDVKKEASANTSMVNIYPMAMIMEAVENYLISKKTTSRSV